jgi:hypothetical protein
MDTDKKIDGSFEARRARYRFLEDILRRNCPRYTPPPPGFYATLTFDVRRPSGPAAPDERRVG